MAFTKSIEQITWSDTSPAQLSESVAVTSSTESDVVTLDTDASTPCWKCSLSVKVDCAGTVGATDKTTFKVLFSNGDPDGAEVADEYDDDELVPGIVIDSNVVDPAVLTFEIPVGAKYFKLRAENAGTANAKTVSAQASITRVAL